jgi:hypothetical protein
VKSAESTKKHVSKKKLVLKNKKDFFRQKKEGVRMRHAAQGAMGKEAVCYVYEKEKKKKTKKKCVDRSTRSLIIIIIQSPAPPPHHFRLHGVRQRHAAAVVLAAVNDRVARLAARGRRGVSAATPTSDALPARLHQALQPFGHRARPLPGGRVRGQEGQLLGHHAGRAGRIRQRVKAAEHGDRGAAVAQAGAADEFDADGVGFVLLFAAGREEGGGKT